MFWKRDLGFIDLGGRGAPGKEAPQIGPGFERALLYLGVILPLLALLFENEFHLCARTFFDPFPSNSHALLFAMIPAANLLAWLSLKRNMHSQLGLALFANGMAVGVAILYTLMFFPVLPASAMAVLIFGVGLLAFAPLFGLGVLCFAGSKVCKVAEAARTYFNPHQVNHAGHLVILAMVLAVELPSTLTRVALGMANHPETARKGIDILRNFGNQEVMLRACYERSGRATDILGSLYESSHPTNVEDMRRIFYKVTGRTYNSFPIPEAARATMNHMGTLGYDGIDNGADDEFDADPDIAGEMVAGVSRGLSVSRSKLDGKFDADAAVGQIDWFLDFKNVSKFDREVRTRIQLPHGAAINKASLIVNDKEYECRITLKEEARAIYRAAVESHRNPLLVSMSGQDSVLVQCYPVPPGENLKLHIGMVSPLELDKNKEAVLALPQFEERNFQINVPHALTLSSNHELKAPWSELKFEHPDAKTFSLKGSIEAAEIATGGGIIHFKRSDLSDFYCKDKFADLKRPWTVSRPAGTVITAESLGDIKVHCPGALHIVIDCSASMKEHFPEIVESLQDLPKEIKSVTLTCATDTGNESLSWSGKINAGIIERLNAINCVGGQSDGSALLEELNRTIIQPDNALLWIHGAQPPAQDNSEQLRMRLEHCPNAIYDMQIASGPNQYLDGCKAQYLQKLPRFGSVKEDLKLLFKQWQEPGFLKKFERVSNLDVDYDLPELECRQEEEAPSTCFTEAVKATARPQADSAAASLAAIDGAVATGCIAAEPASLNGRPSQQGSSGKAVQTMDCLAQLWANDRIYQLLRHGNEQQALELADRYHLVTPVSSAVLVDTVPDLERLSRPQVSLESENYRSRVGGLLAWLSSLEQVTGVTMDSAVGQLNRLNSCPEPRVSVPVSLEFAPGQEMVGAYNYRVSRKKSCASDTKDLQDDAAADSEMSSRQETNAPCEDGSGFGAGMAKEKPANNQELKLIDEIPSVRDSRLAADKFDSGVVTGSQLLLSKQEAGKGSSLEGSTNGSISPSQVYGKTRSVMHESAAASPMPARSAPYYSASGGSADYASAPAPVPSVIDSVSTAQVQTTNNLPFQTNYAASPAPGSSPACPPVLMRPSPAYHVPNYSGETQALDDSCASSTCFSGASNLNSLDIPVDAYGQPDFPAFLKKFWFAVLGLFFLTYTIVQMSLRRLGLVKQD